MHPEVSAYQCWDSYSNLVTSYLLHITFEKSNAICYILLYFLKKSNIITVTYYILLFRTFHDKNDFSYHKPIKKPRKRDCKFQNNDNGIEKKS